MQTVGEMLREERERKGLTLKNIEAETNIRIVYLQAIEDANYSVLPGETYVKGFIRNYANTLGLNGQEYVEIYRKGKQPTPELEEPVALRVERTPEAAVQTEVLPLSESPAPSVLVKRRERSRRSEIQWIVLVIGVLVLGGGGVWWFMSGANKPAPEMPQQQAQQPAPQPVQQPTQQAPVQQPAKPMPATPLTKPVVLAAKFVNQSWVQVTADEKQVYEGIPGVGESMTWQAEQKIVIKVGNAGAVELTHNGQALGKLGGNGEVVLRTFTPGR